MEYNKRANVNMEKSCIVVIQAGGMGTRMAALTKDKVPKPMLKVNGKPLLYWQIEELKKYQLTDICIIIGHLGDAIEEYFGDGSRFGVKIQYIRETKPLASAGALFYLKEFIQNENILLLYSDIAFAMDLDRLIKYHSEKKAAATLVMHPNTHPADSDILFTDAEGRVTDILTKKEERISWYPNQVNAGIYVLSSNVIKEVKELKRMDLESDVIRPLLYQRSVFAYHSPEYIKDAGTPERFSEVEAAYQEKLVNRRCLKNKQRCFFFDRDGTITKYAGLIDCDSKLELEKNAIKAIQAVNESGDLAIIVTNQSVVARGMCDIEDVEKIHWKLEDLLADGGAYVDDIIFCPHHPDKGYPEENPLYKIQCNCRKPKTAMIDRMVERYNIDKEQSFMIGDTTTDIQTGINAGMQTILVKTGLAGKDGKYQVQADYEVKDALEAVKLILERG